MRIQATSRRVLSVALVAAGLAMLGPGAGAADVTIELCAKTGVLTLPSPAGGTVPIWGFGRPSTPGDCSSATAGRPGPLLEVAVGDNVTLSVANGLASPLQLEIPGLASGGTVAPGTTGTLTFTAERPGTYLYESDGDAGRQTAMGLAGALLVRPATPNNAYGPAGTAYDEEQVVVLDAVDPAFEAAPGTFDLTGFTPTYWLLNGKAYPDTLPGITAAPGSRLLLRYVNAGFDNSTMALLGTHQRVVARDARLVPQPFDAVAETVPAGGTEDTIVTMPTSAPPVAAGFALYNRQLRLSNGELTTPTPAPGGALTFVHP
jgi:FtsP/CotA-like multicopper oxidase with cupredoxin domain